MTKLKQFDAARDAFIAYVRIVQQQLHIQETELWDVNEEATAFFKIDTSRIQQI